MVGLTDRVRVWAPAMALLCLAGSAATCRAEDNDLNGPVVRVEEDWELQLGEPQSSDMSPQISTYMWAKDGFPLTMSVHLNFAPYGVFAIGGVQTIASVDDSVVAMQSSGPQAPLQTDGEKITWTQVMAVSNGNLAFGVDNFSSWTWGQLGLGDTAISVPADGLSDLNGYLPRKSLVASGVGYGANRVESLNLVKVRMFDAEGNVLELSGSNLADVNESSTDGQVAVAE
jgi:hypothetical protein